jgi:hypothetical protein
VLYLKRFKSGRFGLFPNNIRLKRGEKIMQSCFEAMVNCKELVELGFKPYQAKQIIRECKEYLAQVEGIDFYYNRQVSIVPARVVEKLFDIQVSG